MAKFTLLLAKFSLLLAKFSFVKFTLLLAKFSLLLAKISLLAKFTFLSKCSENSLARLMTICCKVCALLHKLALLSATPLIFYSLAGFCLGCVGECYGWLVKFRARPRGFPVSLEQIHPKPVTVLQKYSFFKAYKAVKLVGGAIFCKISTCKVFVVGALFK